METNHTVIFGDGLGLPDPDIVFIDPALSFVMLSRMASEKWFHNTKVIIEDTLQWSEFVVKIIEGIQLGAPSHLLPKVIYLRINDPALREEAEGQLTSGQRFGAAWIYRKMPDKPDHFQLIENPTR